MELWEYKLKTTQIGNTDDDESDSNPEINDKVRTKVVKNKKPLKVPFIYYISTCIAQNLIWLPNFSTLQFDEIFML